MSGVSAVIVNWNTREALAECLEALSRDTADAPSDIVVVDNASTDGSADMVEARFPGVRVVRNLRNAGFASAANTGLRFMMECGGSDLFLILNPDAIVRPGCIATMTRHMADNPVTGACGPALRLPDGGFQPGAGGFFPSARTAAVHFLFLSRLFPIRRRPLFLHQAAYAGGREAVAVDWLTGACLMMRRRALEETGFFDERRFIYAEDIDWCARMKRCGWKACYLPYAEAEHAHGLALQGGEAEDERRRKADVRWLDELLDYVAGERGRLEAAALRAVAAAGFLLRAAGYGAVSLARPGGPSGHERSKIMYRYFLRMMSRRVRIPGVSD
jgi:N-acetylglucosaminyl-diphospho-decaprenol L-rhamnosyltransferase